MLILVIFIPLFHSKVQLLIFNEEEVTVTFTKIQLFICLTPPFGVGGTKVTVSAVVFIVNCLCSETVEFFVPSLAIIYQ